MSWLTWACGVKGWTPDQFWKSTFYEVSSAYIGHCRYNGEGIFKRDKNGWTIDDIAEHKANIAKLREEFPDGHQAHYKKQRDKRADSGDGSVIPKAARKKLKRARRAWEANP